MAPERFRTQVLLLHSEQGTLDNLSAGFNDSYTVHCATSGSEALTTLGETDIDIIVSAHDLPGMSGLEALREAKKRSPETIGILFAGSEDKDLEALVGAEEVFQIVRDGFTPESLRSMIDEVTRQAHLMSLAQSANDNTANVDTPPEHIVMETAENGAAIVTDSTNRIPVLEPELAAPEPASGVQPVDVLVLTRDEEFLNTIRESSAGLHKVVISNTLAQAEAAIAGNKVGVAVIDAAMMGDSVEQLAMHLRRKAERLVAVVAGRREDGEMLMDLINRGKVYRFLLKPVSPGRARLAIEASAKYHLEAPDSSFQANGAKDSAPVLKTASAAPGAAAQVAPVPKTPVRPPKPVAAASTAEKPANAVKVPRQVSSDAPGDAPESPRSEAGIVQFFVRSVSGALRLAGAAGSLFGPRTPKLVLGGAAGAVAVLGLGWWIYDIAGEAPPAGRATVLNAAATLTEAATEAPAESEVPAGLDDLLEEARLAAASGHVFEPRGGNAIELFVAAATAMPGDDDIAAELGAVIEQALGMAESAVLERDIGTTAAALQQVAAVDPGNPRLPFLSAQLAQLQLRDYLDASRLAIREERFEDAANALNAARDLTLTDSTEIDLVAGDLSDSLSEQRVDDVLARANARIEENRLTTPSNDNARYYYEVALSIDPGNMAAIQGLQVIASKLIFQAGVELAGGRFDAAEFLLADARRLNPDSAEIASSLAALEEARHSAAEEQARAARVAAERAAAQQSAAETEAAVASDAMVSEIPKEWFAVSSNVPAETTTAEAQFAEASARRPVAANLLNRTRYVAPKYPLAAQRRRVSGWVEVVFTVDIDGSVKDTAVIESQPDDTFVKAALTAIEKWEFEPILEQGVAVEKLASVRMRFELE